MSLEAAVEGLARSLGVWAREEGGPQMDGPLMLDRVETGKCDAWVHGEDQDWTRRPLTPGDAAILLSAMALGVTLDMGPCPACAGSKVQREVRTRNKRGALLAWERRLIQDWRADGWGVETGGSGHRLSRPCPECAAESEPRRWEIDGHTVCAECDDVPFGDCVCPGPRVPTGKVTRSPEQWVLDAMPQTFATLVDGTPWRAPGDQPTREALGVLADKLQAQGETFGLLLGAWLAGECRTCEGSGERPPPEIVERDVLGGKSHIRPPQAADPLRIRRRPRTASDPPGYPEQVWEIDTSCPKCHGRGTTLGAYAPQLEALLLELARAEGGDLHQELPEDAKIQAALDRTEHRLSMSEILDL